MTPPLEPRARAPARARGRAAAGGRAPRAARRRRWCSIPRARRKARVGVLHHLRHGGDVPAQVNREAVRLLVLARRRGHGAARADLLRRAPGARRACGAKPSALARRNVRAFARSARLRSSRDSAGCGAALREAGHLLRDDSTPREAAALLARECATCPRCWRSSGCRRRPRRPLARGATGAAAARRRTTIRVTSRTRSACAAQPRALLRRAAGRRAGRPAELRLVLRQRRRLQPDAPRDGRRAARAQARLDRAASSPDVVVASNPGCLLHMARGARERGIARCDAAPGRAAGRATWPAPGRSRAHQRHGMTAARSRRDAAAALFLERQHLDRAARPARCRRRGLARFVERRRRPPDRLDQRGRPRALPDGVEPLRPLRSRETLDRLIYRRRVLFEYWAHAACFVPRRGPRRLAPRDARLPHAAHRLDAWLRKNPKLLRVVEDAIRERGPLGNADFQQTRPGRRRLVELEAGDARAPLPVDERTLADPLARALPEALRPGRARAARAREHRAAERRRSSRAGTCGSRCARHGRARPSADLRRYLTFPRTPRAERRSRASEAAARGRGGRDRRRGRARAAGSRCAEDLPGARARRRGVAPPRAAPRCCRRSTRSCGTASARARCSASTTASRSTRPATSACTATTRCRIFHDGQLIGRVDAKNHRASTRLEVRHVHFEPWFANGSARRPRAGARRSRRGAGRRGRCASFAGRIRRRNAHHARARYAREAQAGAGRAP